MSDTSAASAYIRVASLVTTADQPESLTEIPVWDPMLGAQTPWQESLNEQLATVLRTWLRGKSFSRKNRRIYEKLNLSVRTGEVELAPLSLP